MKTEPKKIIQAYHKAPWRNQVQWIGLFVLIIVMLGLVAIVYLNVTARAATAGREIQWIQYEILEIERKILDKKTELAAATSVDVMRERAEEIGFTKTTTNELDYILVPYYRGSYEVTLAPSSTSFEVKEPELPPEFTMTLLDLVKDFTLASPAFVLGGEEHE